MNLTPIFNTMAAPPANTSGTISRPLPRFVEQTAGAGDDAAIQRTFVVRLMQDQRQPSPSPANAPTWLGDVYSLVRRNQPDAAVDILFRHVDDMLLKDEFSRCNALLRAIDLKRLDTNLIVAVLSITVEVSSQLSYRSRFVGRAEKRLQELAPERVERLLSGLR